MTDTNSIETFVSKFISVLFHPLLMPSMAYFIIVLFGVPVQHEQEALWLALYGLYVYVLTFVFPVLVFLLLLRYKMISALQMPVRRERSIPILVTASFFYILFHFSRSWEIDPVFGLYMLGATMLSLIAMLINYWWKISLHTLGAGGLTGAATTLSLYFSPSYFRALPFVVILAGLVAFSRLKLKAHTQAEVYAGLILGFALIFLLFTLMVG